MATTPRPRGSNKHSLLNCICIKYSFLLEIFLIQLLGNPNWKLFQFIFQTETLFLLLDRVSFCGRGHSITSPFKLYRPILKHTVSPTTVQILFSSVRSSRCYNVHLSVRPSGTSFSKALNLQSFSLRSVYDLSHLS